MDRLTRARRSWYLTGDYTLRVVKTGKDVPPRKDQFFIWREKVLLAFKKGLEAGLRITE
jgi:hypothetical protein